MRELLESLCILTPIDLHGILFPLKAAPCLLTQMAAYFGMENITWDIFIKIWQMANMSMFGGMLLPLIYSTGLYILICWM